MAGEWDAGFQRGAMGLGMGTALGALLHQVCFIAGTQVITGIEYEDELGQPATLTAKGFAHLAGESSTALQLRILRYLTQSIETLQPGQAVLTRDEHNPDGTLLLRHIEETFIRTAYHLQIVTIRSSTGIEQTLHTTAEHPFYVLGKGWIDCGDIKPGDQLQEPNGGLSTVLASCKEIHAKASPSTTSVSPAPTPTSSARPAVWPSRYGCIMLARDMELLLLGQKHQARSSGRRLIGRLSVNPAKHAGTISKSMDGTI